MRGIIRPIGAAVAQALTLALSMAGCAMPVSKLPDLPADLVAAEQRREQIAQLRKYYGELHRVDTIAFRLRTANVADCKDWVSAQIGLYAVTPRSLPRKYQSYIAEALNIGWMRPTAISVVEDSPAANAGIVAGDEIIALNGELIPLWGTAGWMGGWLKANGVKPVEVAVRHDGVDRVVTVTPVMGCAIPIAYTVDADANASASDTKITINTGIVALAETDAQLALVIGHEMAHSNLGHNDKKRWNQLLGTTTGAAVDVGILAGGVSTGGLFARQFGHFGALAYSVGFEREADYVGAYYAARAGYDLNGAEDFWRRLGLLAPATILVAKTHPINATRLVQLQKVTAEIEDKKRRHEPLVPDLKYVSVEHDPAPGDAAAVKF
ncbi:MAG: M48 family metalloprotease [Proteobacteria bacterium]|nr:M48 family metalloprotease [Pseudomonadota bacterium]